MGPGQRQHPLRCLTVVRELPAAAVISLVVHGAIAVAWLVGSGDGANDAPPVAPRVAVTTAEPTFEIEFLDTIPESRPPDPPIAAAPPKAPAKVAVAKRPREPRAREKISTGHAATVELPKPPETTTPPTGEPPRTTRDPLMTMRRPERPELPDVPAKFVDEFLARTKPPAEVPDLPGARIDARLAALKERLRDPNYVANATPEQLGDDRAQVVALRQGRDEVELVRRRDGSYTSDKTTFKAKIDPDGKAHIEDKANLKIEGLSGRFDVTDWMMRRQGMDPYAREKLKFLDRTRDQRVAIGQEHRRAKLSQSAALMQRNVNRLWATVLDPAGRKQGLFELWDECAETGSDELVAGGAAARTLAVNFIQVKLRGADAYTADELARLNARRRSAATFAPYQ